MGIRLVTTVLVSAILLFAPFGQVFAHTDSATPASEEIIEVPYESVNPPDGTSYWFKRLKEKIVLFFAFSNENKSSVYRKQLGARLAELEYIVENKEMAYFEKATQRYFTTAGQLTEFLVAKKLQDRYEETKGLFSSHIPVLIQLRNHFDPATAEWRFIEDDINYLGNYANQLSP